VITANVPTFTHDVPRNVTVVRCKSNVEFGTFLDCSRGNYNLTMSNELERVLLMRRGLQEPEDRLSIAPEELDVGDSVSMIDHGSSVAPPGEAFIQRSKSFPQTPPPPPHPHTNRHTHTLAKRRTSRRIFYVLWEIRR